MMLNKKHRNTRQRMGKRAILVDRSMKRIKDVPSLSEVEEETAGQEVFEDKTDWQNEDFIYVY